MSSQRELTRNEKVMLKSHPSEQHLKARLTFVSDQIRRSERDPTVKKELKVLLLIERDMLEKLLDDIEKRVVVIDSRKDPRKSCFYQEALKASLGIHKPRPKKPKEFANSIRRRFKNIKQFREDLKLFQSPMEEEENE